MPGGAEMKIGIDARILQGTLRGQGHYVYYLIRHLAALGGGNEYRALYNGLRKARFACDLPAANLQRVWCRVPGSLLRRFWAAGRGPLAEDILGPLDVFHNPINFNLTHFTPVPSRCPMVATFNGMADPATIWTRCDERRINAWFRAIAEGASRIIAVSQSVREDLLQRVGPSVEEKVRVVYYGVSEAFRPDLDQGRGRAIREKYGLAGTPYILYVGAAEKNKNLEGLLRAYESMATKTGRSAVGLVLVGRQDEHYARIRGLARELGIASSVVFPGHIGHDELPFLYQGARLFVLPTFHEWFGIPLLEAMACGIPVAASRARGVPEVVGDAAMLFDPADQAEISAAMSRLLDDEGLRSRLISRGLERVKGFSWDETARKTIAVYREAAGR